MVAPLLLFIPVPMTPTPLIIATVPTSSHLAIFPHCPLSVTYHFPSHSIHLLSSWWPPHHCCYSTHDPPHELWPIRLEADALSPVINVVQMQVLVYPLSLVVHPHDRQLAPPIHPVSRCSQPWRGSWSCSTVLGGPHHCGHPLAGLGRYYVVFPVLRWIGRRGVCVAVIGHVLSHICTCQDQYFRPQRNTIG